MYMSNIEKFEKIQSEGLALFKKKNADYGNRFADFWLVGILTRLQDKINRSINITKTNITVVQDESLRDTLLDLQNYCTLALLLFNDNSVQV